jgi:GGDEF domain-containing protein
VARQLRAKTQTFLLVYPLGDGTSATVGVCIGIAMAPEHGTDPKTLLALADAAPRRPNPAASRNAV